MRLTVPIGRKLIIRVNAHKLQCERSQSQDTRAKLLLTRFPSSNKRFKMSDRKKEEVRQGHDIIEPALIKAET